MTVCTLLACHGPEQETTLLAGYWLDNLSQWPAPLFYIGGVIAVVAIVFGSVTKITVSRAREQTRREIAAYVAEGTLDADKGIELLKAGESSEDEDE